MSDGEIVLVTGAARGIGAATALHLAGRGYRVAVSARHLADAEAIARQIGGSAHAVACDVADQASVEQAIASVEAALGPVTILVNNAGMVQPIGLLHETDPAAWAANISTTLVGAAAVTRAVLPGMLRRSGGRIVNLSSGAAHQPLEGWSAYCAAKAGLAMLTRSIALEYGGRGIRSFGFAPGVVDTGMQAEIRASGINPVSRLPRESLANPADPARAIAYLCTEEADDLAGREIDIRDQDFRKRVGLAG
ncbi:SDR family NAD(P)-dependent oxidoreductase [Kaistia dalseonensis]|uniref:NAD(P)-dependent dehydrogenase (Short-subunit alcohol dehydrogenase family) n=1 Tax=Kaistia dalseonensis TaxID=410840 RepID=A0ABU0H8H7_9HYPH|nr:SDR family oxidoreductase [Kaistia dalseonensis]MCX5496017.1 SDR family NAD(P)-dependent oxidoreductase [Kaistia dalseonensis]MDQ0438621.1 NAD(P)-dependent dehydrogenase (short-subunit alcohol dehydrogenase family) [Kaistia dalseonensis]